MVKEQTVWFIQTSVKQYGPFDSYHKAVEYMINEQLLNGFIVCDKITMKDMV